MNRTRKNLHRSTWGSPSSPTVLLLHGFMGCGEDWEPVANQLSERYYCLAPDLPGHGRSALPEALDFSSCASAILGTVEAAGRDRCHLVGYSMGGRLGLYLMLHHGERFHQVAIESASPGLRNEAERETRWQADRHLAERLNQDSFTDFLRQWYALPLFALGDEPALTRELIHRRSQHEPAALAVALEALSVARQPDLWPQLARHRQPWLYLAGERDTKYCGVAAELDALSPAVSVEILPDCGHNTHLQQPAAFAARLDAYFTKEAPP